MSEITATVRVIASTKTWIEGEALRQLEKTAALPGMKQVVGMPDLHPGRGNPIGAAFVTAGIFYPLLVGNDVGCGMGLWHTGLARAKFKAQRALKRLVQLEEPFDEDTTPWLDAAGIEPTGWEAALGTIGGGNHFAELQAVERVVSDGDFAHLGLDSKELYLVVHSGSRGYGEALLREHVHKHKAGGLTAGSDEAALYLQKHDLGVAWGKANRALLAHRFLGAIRGAGQRILDVCHNSVTAVQVEGCQCWLHRKGAAPADEGPIIIPGSRGTFSYLVQPIGDQAPNAYSLAHGAGRKWSRSDSKDKLGRCTAEDLKRTALGSYVICEDKDLLFEEAPQAYKDIDRVVNDLVEAGHITIVAVMRPVITFKTAYNKRYERD